jgi:hypothetical protein
LLSRNLNNVHWGEPIVVGEIKGEVQKKISYTNPVGLIRIRLLSKDCIDNNYYGGIIGVHEVGKSIFYRIRVVVLLFYNI